MNILPRCSLLKLTLTLFDLIVFWVYLSVCLPARLPTCLPACLSTCLPACLPACLLAFLSASLSVDLASVYLSISLSLPVHLSYVHLSVYLSVHLYSVHMLVWLSVCMSVLSSLHVTLQSRLNNLKTRFAHFSFHMYCVKHCFYNKFLSKISNISQRVVTRYLHFMSMSRSIV